MKSLKFDPKITDQIISGSIYKTWRYADDKDIAVMDQLQLIDSKSGEVFGYGLVDEVATKQIKNLNEYDKNGHQQYLDDTEMMNEFRKYYGKEITSESIVKIIKFTYSATKLDNNVVNNSSYITEVKLFTDGGSRGNPGPSATGIVIQDMEGNVVINTGKYLGITTNNQAEYQAVLQGLNEANDLGARVVHVYLDSLLVVNQMSGIFKIKNRELWPIHQAIREISGAFEKVSFTHVPREMNKLADAEVNKALDAAEKNGIRSELL